MKIDRRHLAIAGAAAIGASSLLRNTPAFADDETALKAAVEELRKAILAADKEKLAALTASELSYGHSSAVVQDKATFIDGVVNLNRECERQNCEMLRALIDAEPMDLKTWSDYQAQSRSR